MNESMLELLEIADGTRTLREVAGEIHMKYSWEDPDRIQNVCAEAIRSLIEMGVCEATKHPQANETSLMRHCLEIPLDHLIVAVTTRCNFRCCYCYVEPLSNLSDMPVDVFCNTVEEAVEHLGVLDVTITGGEPLLVDDLERMVAFATDKSCRVYLLTNGSLLSPERLKALMDSGLYGVSVSMDTCLPSEYEALTGSRGVFRNVYRNLCHSCSEGLPTDVGVVLVKGVNDEVDIVKQLVGELGRAGVRRIAYTTVVPFGGARGKEQFVIEPEAVAHIGALIDESFSCTYGIDASPNYVFHPEDLPSVVTESTVCPAGKAVLHVMADGRIVPCPGFTELTLGYTGKCRLTDLWRDSKGLLQLRSYDASEVKECSNCEFVKLCAGGCRARAFCDTGRLTGRDRWACALYGRSSNHDAGNAPKGNTAIPYEETG